VPCRRRFHSAAPIEKSDDTAGRLERHAIGGAATIPAAIKTSTVKHKTGYSGLMLPILEIRGWRRRWSERAHFH